MGQGTFREAMRRVANTVHLVTTRFDGQNYGMVATAVSSLSMDPCSLLVCINTNASVHAPLRRAGRLCVNILAVEQLPIAQRFSDPARRAERFDTDGWLVDESGLPYLGSAVGSLFCGIERCVDWATHTVFLASVDNVLLGEPAAPLLYLGGRYVELEQPAAPAPSFWST
jgi:flavin reductase (DIM6/NTAB) family NADH-FMN oxidoreductase RutF